MKEHIARGIFAQVNYYKTAYKVASGRGAPDCVSPGDVQCHPQLRRGQSDTPGSGVLFVLFGVRKSVHETYQQLKVANFNVYVLCIYDFCSWRKAKHLGNWYMFPHVLSCFPPSVSFPIQLSLVQNRSQNRSFRFSRYN